MFGRAGHAYVYFTYGVHWMFNIVTGQEGAANAVLLRALEPLEGLDLMIHNRGGRPLRGLTAGPARLAQALAIDSSLNGLDLCLDGAPLWLESGRPVPDGDVAVGPRIGLGSTPEPWRSIPWRFWLKENMWVSTAAQSRPRAARAQPSPGGGQGDRTT
jgi:DNA-3-methyladenine glycosylase